MNVKVLPDLKAISTEAARIFAALSKQYIEKSGNFIVAVSGGSTPKILFSILGSSLYKNRISWDYIHFFFVDERFVPRSHEDSNFRLLNDTLFHKIAFPEKNIHSVETDVSSPSLSARIYEQEIINFFQIAKGKFPSFHLIILGIGEDGHTASLFSRNKILKEKSRMAASVSDKKHPHPRITLTLPVINNADNIIFLVSGHNKSVILKKIVNDRNHSFPASLVNPQKGSVFFILDRDAGNYLKEKP